MGVGIVMSSFKAGISSIYRFTVTFQKFMELQLSNEIKSGFVDQQMGKYKNKNNNNNNKKDVEIAG